MTTLTDRPAILRADREHLLHPLHHSTDAGAPFVWARGERATLYDADGRAYLDGLSGLWNVNVGHGRRELADAAAAQMSTLGFMSSYAGHTNAPAAILAERLAQVCYPSIQRFFFASGGGESNDAAIKTARYYWYLQGRPEKQIIISREHAYHGVTIGAMSATGMPGFWPMFGGVLPGYVHISSPYPYRFERRDPHVSPGVEAANRLEQAIAEHGSDRVAAFIAEPVQGAGGVIVPPDDYFPRIREICTHHNVLLIADEVITGFGRTGAWFGLTRYGIEPDLITFAKGITSGYVPLGGIGVAHRIADAIAEAPGDRKWMHAYTYSGHPVACAVALANIEILEREGLVEAAARQGARLLAGLRTLETLSHVGDVRGLGLMAAVEFVQDRSSKAALAPTGAFGARVLAECARRGLITRTRGDILALAPPFVVTDEEIDRIVSIVGEAIAAATRAKDG